MPGGEGLTLGVNVSHRQLSEPNFPVELSAALEATGLDPRALRLEVREHDLARDAEATRRTLAHVLETLGVRWQHPSRGPVKTSHLLHVAEQTAVMQLLTARVIDDVVAQVAAWRSTGLTMRASLNVSARDLFSGEIATQLSRRLSEYSVPADQIQLEITESALMTDVTRAHNTIEEISALGVAVALDDFGTGYSSLQHLRKLPLTEIKIDQSFVGGMARNGDDAAIVRSTVELARALGLRTVAEGVENSRTWALLGQIGCSLAQGWYTARPMPGDLFPAWLADYRTPAAEGAPVV
jgi:EAL domain-containing protein (putative c-di-GMP-specific phosphodiesterase class I)